MTSSFKATHGASVRGAESTVLPDSPWPLDEFAAPMADAAYAGGADVVEHALVDLTSATDEAYRRGLADGERRAQAAAQAQVRDALEAVRQMAQELEGLASLAPAVIEENVAALAVIVARQIVAREVTLDDSLVADLVRRALTEFPVEKPVRIRVHPLDLSVLTVAAGAPGATPITGVRDASWLADPTVARGGCLIEGPDRIVDGRVDSALERAYHRMAMIDAS